MSRFWIVFLLTLAAVLPGCTEPPEAIHGPPLDTSGFWSNETDDRSDLRPARRVARIRVSHIEVPSGQSSDSEEIWSYLAEEPIGADRLAELGRNGLRVGLGRSDMWADVAEVLKRMTGRELTESVQVGHPGSLHHIALKRRQDVQTIFIFHADRTLSGSDLPPGDNVLTIACTVDQDDSQKMLLTGIPQVRSTRPRTRYAKGARGVRMIKESVMFGFRDLLFQVPMNAKDFLVIGPGAAARRPHSVGRHFFVRQKEGMEFETVLVLTPEVLDVPVK
ncbi:MAG: hypothetical protein QF577_04355 [Phycisphaerae bacterium]|jgi:hypothetical protein|nr:hypothetical protein [Phycisphaerae bacterium]MDP7636765.1 hypothetical protein [Phycisphaerae bacterium]